MTDVYLNNLNIDWEFCKVLNNRINDWNLETLTLKQSLNDEKVIEKLFNGLNLKDLKWFELSDNHLDCDGCSAINFCLLRSKIDYLELINCSLTEKKCKLLFEGLDLC